VHRASAEFCCNTDTISAEYGAVLGLVCFAGTVYGQIVTNKVRVCVTDGCVTRHRLTRVFCFQWVREHKKSYPIILSIALVTLGSVCMMLYVGIHSMVQRAKVIAHVRPLSMATQLESGWRADGRNLIVRLAQTHRYAIARLTSRGKMTLFHVQIHVEMGLISQSRDRGLRPESRWWLPAASAGP
jgi:hypothetical protein